MFLPTCVMPAYICTQGMPYIPTKLEQYAESVITAVSAELYGLCVVSRVIYIHVFFRLTCYAHLPSTHLLCILSTTL